MTTRAVAEVTVAHRAAVRDLMATGATRAEAEAAVNEELGRNARAALAPMAEEIGRSFGRAFTAAVRAAHEVAGQVGRAMGRTQAGVPPWQVPAGRRQRDYRLVR